MMKAAFFSSGMTTTQRARVQYSCGISGRMSRTALAANVNRLDSLANALPTARNNAAPAATIFFIHTSIPFPRATPLPTQMDGLSAWERYHAGHAATQKTGSAQKSDARVRRAHD